MKSAEECKITLGWIDFSKIFPIEKEICDRLEKVGKFFEGNLTNVGK